MWQALVQGFAGIRPAHDHLLVDPHLPRCWTALEIPVRYRGTRVRFRFEPDSVRIEADQPVRLRFPGDRTAHQANGRARYRRELWGWQEVRS
jgi:trehalose/maltose hydrolase-like predicted phosphorylase